MSAAVATEFFLLSAIWGASFLFIKMGASEFGPLPAAALRTAIATLFLLPLLGWRGQLGVLRAHWRRVLLLGLLNSALPFACFAFAVLSITTGLSAILNATVPLFGALVAWLWLGDRPAASRVLGLAIGFAGVALLAWDSAGLKPGAGGLAPAWALGACLVATLCYGFSANATKVWLDGLPPLVTATGSQLGATLGLALPALWLWPAQAPGARAWAAMAALGVLCTGVAYILYFRLIEKAGPAKALAATFVIPVFAVGYGVLLLGEPLTLRMLGCGAIIVAGTALSTGLLRLPTRRTA
ncbi:MULTISPECIES: DMT family transporter [Ramlibacter]|nr:MULTISPECIES: DMT family transporter [Ramlibacter]